VANTRYSIYRFNAGTGSVMKMRTDWHFSQGEGDMIRQVDVTMRSGTTNAVEVKVFGNENTTTPVITKTLTPANTGLVKLASIRNALTGLRSFCVQLTQTTSAVDSGFEEVLVSGSTQNIVE
jgi:hypothetical protein